MTKQQKNCSACGPSCSCSNEHIEQMVHLEPIIPSYVRRLRGTLVRRCLSYRGLYLIEGQKKRAAESHQSYGWVFEDTYGLEESVLRAYDGSILHAIDECLGAAVLSRIRNEYVQGARASSGLSCAELRDAIIDNGIRRLGLGDASVFDCNLLLGGELEQFRRQELHLTYLSAVIPNFDELCRASLELYLDSLRRMGKSRDLQAEISVRRVEYADRFVRVPNADVVEFRSVVLAISKWRSLDQMLAQRSLLRRLIFANVAEQWLDTFRRLGDAEVKAGQMRSEAKVRLIADRGYDAHTAECLLNEFDSVVHLGRHR